MPPAIYTATWILMALGYTYSGFTKLMSPSWLDGTVLARVLENALMRPRILRETLLALPSGVLQLASWGALGVELVFAPLALFSRLRPWLWGLMLAIQVSLITVIDFADQSLAMVMLHLFTFDPAWVRPQKASGAEMIFYDGHCGLCHQAVRFVLAEDGTGDIFRFAPLDSEAFRAAVRASDRAALPDSLIVLTTDGLLLTRSAAVLHLLRRLGGVWRLLGNVLSVIPTPVRDRVYDKIARIRHSLFRAPAQACPLVPANLRGRFQV
jgi:predicted DCC family thiol-disulfide oxidoreductase YuxK